MFRIGVDIGGTFTDCVVVSPDGRRTVSKALTSHGALTDGVMEALAVNARIRELSVEELLEATEHLVHGTTVATNAVLTRTGARTGLLTTLGHEDALVIGKVHAKRAGLSEREVVHASRLNKPTPLVDASQVIGIAERIDADGDVVVPLLDEAIDAAIDRLLATGVEAVAISFLWSFVNPTHEQRVRDRLRERAPDLFVTVSSDIAPVLGEYERTVTTVLNAYVGPKVAGYLTALERQLSERGLAHPLLVMQASGGVTTVADASSRPVLTLDSGPTGGVLGCRHLSEIYGEPNVICTDVGGTSFDVAVIADGALRVETEPIVAQYAFRMPKVAVATIGAGGGSVAWLDEGGLLRVGPQSAGSRPGPACYGRGGTEPTVTDADLVLGYLDPDAFLGGRMRLDPALSRQALATIAGPAGMEVEEVAIGISRIANAQMADLIRRSSVEAGHDPRQCVLVAYGGAGPTRAVAYGQDIAVRAILIPRDSTVFSAEGMLACDIQHSRQVSLPLRSPFGPDALSALTNRFEELEDLLAAQFLREALALDGVEWERTVSVRYQKQVHTLDVRVPPGVLEESAAQAIEDGFADEYRRVFGDRSLLRGAALELDVCRLVGTYKVAPLRLQRPERAPGGARRDSVRSVYFEQGGFLDTTVLDGADLADGTTLHGPAIVQRMGDSVVIPPGFVGRVDSLETIFITADGAESWVPADAGYKEAVA